MITSRKLQLSRREFVGAMALAAFTGCAEIGARRRDSARLFFTSAGKTNLIAADGSGLQTLEFDIPNQATWQPGPILSDGRRVIFLSMEPRRDGPGRPFEEYYTQTPTHLWLYDLDRKSLKEIANLNRLAVFYTPQALLNDERMLVQVVRAKVGQVFSMNLDGSEAREFTRAGEGLPYGFSVRPSDARVAFHLASPNGYQIWTSDAEGGNRKLVAAHPDRLYFGPTWSPDGNWLLFQGCNYKSDPAHEASDIFVARPDGAELRALTEGQSHWFGATYGNPQFRGSGSNMPTWTRSGEILFSRRTPGAKPPWDYQPNRPDVDHFNRDWKPESAHGGAEICRINPRDGTVTRLSRETIPSWDFRAAESPNGRMIAFCRCPVGETPAVWTMNSDGSNPRKLTTGIGGQGADFPRWLPARRIAS